MVGTNKYNQRFYPASTGDYTCGTEAVNTSGLNTGSWWQDYSSMSNGMTVTTESSYFTYTAISYRPQIS
jgi:hypothetical protein